MTLNDYQKQALTTCMPSCDNFSYMMLNLVGELGELASKIAKHIRKEDLVISNDKLLGSINFRRDDVAAIKGELGDILWQLSGLCHTFGFTLEEVAQHNLDKLASRQQRGVIDGNGDNR